MAEGALCTCLGQVSHLVDLVRKFLVERLKLFEKSLDVCQLVNHGMVLHRLAFDLQKKVERKERAVRHQ